MNRLKSTAFFIKLRSFYRNDSERELYGVRRKFYSSFLSKGDLVFDVGANVGNRAEVFLSLKNKVVAVEPQEACRRVLRIKFGKKISLVKEGLGAKEEVKTMYISSSSTVSSFADDWIKEVKRNRFKDEEWNDREEIPITTLEKLIARYGKPKFIKIDVEGFELEVLKGLKQPVEHISLEYTVPEQTGKALECVTYIGNLSDTYEFNYSSGESMELGLPKYVPAEEFIKIVKSREFAESSNGDIYAKARV